MMVVGSLLEMTSRSKNKNAPNQPSSRNRFEMVVDTALLPEPARPCIQRTFCSLDGHFTQSSINDSTSNRVPIRHSVRLQASISAGANLCSTDRAIIYPDHSW